MKLSIDSCWKIINGECTLRDSLLLAGYDDSKVDSIMDSVKEPGIDYCLWVGALIRASYRKLVSAKQIDSNKIFSLAERKYSNECENQSIGDLGIMDERDFIYTGRGWIPRDLMWAYKEPVIEKSALTI